METFERYEKKYLISEGQRDALLMEISENLTEAEYPDAKICSVYYDTDSFELIRRSLEKPSYKEKLRIRSYCQPHPERIFIELKKKMNGVVYKRRTTVDYRDFAENGIQNCTYDNPQIGKEIQYFDRFYANLKPKFEVSVERKSYVDKKDHNLRLTFDRKVFCRWTDLNPNFTDERLLPEDIEILEIKTITSFPKYLVDALNKLQIYPTSFSKYGAAYTKRMRGEII